MTACLKKKLQCNLIKVRPLFSLSHIEGLNLVRLITVLSSNHLHILFGNSYKLCVWGNILFNFVYVVRKNSLTQ